MKRELFVFSGQSNMMGAAVYPPKISIVTKDAYEYKHRPVLLGAESGEFCKAGYPCGEFSYIDPHTAFSAGHLNEKGESDVAAYSRNTYFCPAMYNLKDDEKKETYPFDYFSEQNLQPGATLAPLFAMEWEKRGHLCAYAHIAKGSVSVFHYFNREMAERYNARIRVLNQKNGTHFPENATKMYNDGAAAYFFRKCGDFFRDAVRRFPDDDCTVRPFVWLQGEAEAGREKEEYRTALEILWKKCLEIGFTHFLCPRIDYFGDPRIYKIMEGEEDFCRETENAFIVTRALSFMRYPGQKTDDWFTEEPGEEYACCRDSFFGYENSHINEKGFMLAARRMADNTVRILKEKKEPIPEKEIIIPILNDRRSEKR